MKVKDLRPGDIVATSSPTGFLPKGIRFFMRRWAKKHYGIEPEKFYNHTFMVLESGSDPKIVEAVGRGLTGHRMFEQYDPEDLNHLVVFRTREPWSEQEIRLLREKADEMAYRNIEYEFLNFLWWMVYILTNGKIDLSPKGEKAGKRLFCFELSVILLNAAKKMFAVPSHVNTVDLQADPRFTQLFLDKPEKISEYARPVKQSEF